MCFFICNDLFYEQDNRCVYKNYIVKNLSNDIEQKFYTLKFFAQNVTFSTTFRFL